MWRAFTQEAIAEEASSAGILGYAKQLLNDVRLYGDEKIAIDVTGKAIRIDCNYLAMSRIYCAMWDLFLKGGQGFNLCTLRINPQYPLRRDCVFEVDVKPSEHMNQVQVKIETKKSRHYEQEDINAKSLSCCRTNGSRLLLERNE